MYAFQLSFINPFNKQHHLKNKSFLLRYDNFNVIPTTTTTTTTSTSISTSIYAYIYKDRTISLKVRILKARKKTKLNQV